MGGLLKVLKIYGQMTVTRADGKKTVWVYDNANDKAIVKEDMTPEQLKESEKAKYLKIKNAKQGL